MKGEAMRGLSGRVVLYGLLGAVVAVGLGACASGEQWAEWRSHSTHFASDDHMVFSLKNQGSTPRVTRQDQRVATAQSWWGKLVIPRPGQIFED
jgi:hypothetical protein